MSHAPLHIQRWLRDHITVTNCTNEDAFAFLLETYAVKAKQHPQYPSLWLFKYDQVASPFAQPLVRECRGIILDAADDWRVISRAFDKFFNHGEGLAATIDWSTASVQEKLDGSLCVLYPYDGKWHVATSGTPDAGGEVNDFGLTFRELFWKVMGDTELPPIPDHPGSGWNSCYYFELTGPMNRVVVQHREPCLTLLGARNLHYQCEYPLHQLRALFQPNIAAVLRHDLSSLVGAMATFDQLSPLEHEGYVICDAQFNRIKVKHPGYIALHNMKGGLSRRAFVEVARTGETSEVLSAFPEFTEQIAEIQGRLNKLLAEVSADYERLKDIPGQKDFAVQAVTTRLPAALFSIRKAWKGEGSDMHGAVWVRQYVKDMQIDRLIDLLGYRKDSDEGRTSREVLLRGTE